MTVQPPNIPAPGTATIPTPSGAGGISVDEGVVNWAAWRQAAGTQMEPMPLNEYDLVIVKSENTKSSTNKIMFKVTWKVLNGPHVGRTVPDNITVSPENGNAMAIFFRKMEALGLNDQFFAANPSTATVAEAMVGRSARCKVKQEEYGGVVRNKVDRVLGPVTGVAATGGFGPGAAVPVGPTGLPGPAYAQAPQPQFQAPPQPQYQAPAPQQYAQPQYAPQPVQQPEQQPVQQPEQQPVQLTQDGYVPQPEPQAQAPAPPQAPPMPDLGPQYQQPIAQPQQAPPPPAPPQVPQAQPPAAPQPPAPVQQPAQQMPQGAPPAPSAPGAPPLPPPAAF